MNPRHVVSLPLAQRLKDAGFPQDCEFAWFEQEGHHGIAATNNLHMVANGSEHLCAAPLLSEIMEQMPGRTALCGVDGHGDPDYAWTVGRGVDDDEDCRSADTGPDTAALLWLALKGEK